MFDKGLITSLFFLVLAGLAKGTSIGMKLMIIAGAGLAGMYMMHLLAQDYNKIQSNNRYGRSVPDITPAPGPGLFHSDPTTTPALPWDETKWADEQGKKNDVLVSLDKILQLDPTGCARRYVCTISSKSSKKLTQPEKNIIRMLRNLPRRSKPESGQAAFRFALDLGRRRKDAQACADEYPKCLFTISQMLKLVGFS